jgi:hypothetical protein
VKGGGAQIWDSKGWRRAVAVLGAAYCLVAWVLPVVVMLVFRELPYLQERGFLDRLAFSAAGTVALVAAMVTSFPGRTRIYRGARLRDTVSNLLWVGLGLAMFTAIAALWSANTFGVLARLLPGDDYSARFTVGDVDRGGSRLRSISLSLAPKDGNGEVHLTLSKRLFDLPEIRAGDELLVSGKRTAAGVYVEGFRVLSGATR